MPPRKRDAAAAELPIAWNAVVGDLMHRIDNVRRAFLQAERERLRNIDWQSFGDDIDRGGAIRHSPLPTSDDRLCVSCAAPVSMPPAAGSVRWRRLGTAQFACWKCFDRLNMQ